MRVADYVAEFLVANGIDTVFLLSGGGMMHLMDGLACNRSLHVVCHHHEQAAGMAAEGYARARGGLGVCFGTSGPGGTNLVSSIAGAWTDSTPVLYITGQSKLSQTIQGSGIASLRQFGTFEVDISQIVKPITKRSYFVRSASEIPLVFDEAMRLALSGRPGPVLIDIPVDIQGAPLPAGWPTGKSESHTSNNLVELNGVVARWKKSRRPLLWLGHGVRVANSSLPLVNLAEVSGTPVVTTMLAKDVIPYDHPLFVGHPGTKGDRNGNWAVQSADFILFIGSSLHVLNTGYELNKFATGAYKVQFDIDVANFEKEAVGVNEHFDLGVPECARELLSSWQNTKLDGSSWLDWVEKLRHYKRAYPVSRENHLSEKGRINLYTVMASLNETCPNDSVVVTDAGSAFYVVGQCLRAKRGQRVLSSGGLGAMGWGVPAAVGASFALPTLPIVCITGDGSLQTNIHELSVVAGNQRNIKIVLLNNEGYLSIKTTQDNYFESRYLGVNKASGVNLPNLKLLCAAYGIDYCRITREEFLREVLEDAFKKDGPILLDVQCNIDQAIIPTVSSIRKEDGTMESRPLEDMAPFLDRTVIDAILSDLRS